VSVKVAAPPPRPAPAQEAWPLFGIRIETPRLQLRPVDDDLIPTLAQVARAGVHDDGTSPFANGWTDRPAAEWESGFARYFWAQRGSWRPDSWALPFAVLFDGNPVGVQQLTAERFHALRTVGTGSWLSRHFQGYGIGTEMREAVLHLAFGPLDAHLAVSGAFPTASASIRVSEKVGYERNGTRRDLARDTPVDSILFRLTREQWLERDRTPVAITGLDGCGPFFGLELASARAGASDAAGR
jgi:RimJ/RimL family protein N-acetyltransferase